MIDHTTISIWLIDGQSRIKLIDNLLEFKLDQQVNRHPKVSLKGVTGSRDKEIAAEAKIEIKQQDTVIFRGEIVTYQINAHSQYWELELEAAATTCELDLEVKRRTFQNEKLTYAELIKNILAEYPGAQYDIPSDYGKKTIDQVYLQFDETDWQYLIRLASALNLVLISDPVAEKPKIHFGLPSVSAATKPVPKTAVYHLVKDWAAYRWVAENSLLTQTTETDYEIYQVEETGDLLNVGDPVNYHGDDRLVYQVTVTKRDSELIQECRLAKAGGFQQTRIYNKALRGLTIKGTVVERGAGQDGVSPVAVKVRFTIDKVYESKHQTKDPGIYHWFPYAPFYAAEGCTGLYCLPEVGEQVALYFPGCKEKEAFVTNSYRLPDRVTITDPNIKCLRTAFGKKLVFTENGIKIVGQEGAAGKKDLVYIELESDGNLIIHSDSKISFQAAQTLNAHAQGKVDITADDYIYLTSNGCSIKMTGGNDFKGLKVLQKPGKVGKKNVKKKTNNTSNTTNNGGSASSRVNAGTSAVNSAAAVTTPITNAYWEYSQSTGRLTRVDSNGMRRFVATGYSGHGEGVNNPDMQGIEGVGPIPRGTWTIGRQYDSSTLGQHVMNLTPEAGTNTFNRNLFRIHGDNSRGDQSASHGCIILARNIRDQIANSNINELRVIR